jgi:hypothetical protein
MMQFNTTEVLSYTEPAASLLAGPLENARVLQPELTACFGSPSGRWERPQAPPGARQKPGSGPVHSLTLDGPIESRYQYFTKQ